jgi:phosphatidate cytidylyltransferase
MRCAISTVASVATAPPLARADRGDVRLRLASALVLAPPALALAWLGGPYLAALVILAAAGMGWEWARLTGCGTGPLACLVVLATTLPVLAMGWGSPRLALALVPAAALAVWVLALRVRGAQPAWAALGAAWIALPCLSCLWLGADAEAGRRAVLWLFATVWASDSGAFAAGRCFGGPRLAPRLSPSKTWSGALGGMLGAAAVAWAFAWWTGGDAALVIPAGIALGIAAQCGDLVESLAKRRFGVKDSSGLIPGHGGLLDRLDGMLAAAALQSLMTLIGGMSPLVWQA